MKKLLDTVFIGDLHGKDVWKSVINKHERYVFLGDYVDSFTLSDDEILLNLKEILYFKMNTDNVELLWGNHDLQYLYPRLRCSGYRESMASALYLFFTENRKQFKIAWGSDNILATHAGINHLWYSESLDLINSFLNKGFSFAETLEIIFNSLERDIIFWCSLIRDGKDICGGPLWNDKREFKLNGTLANYTQIVGHSHVPDITEIKSGSGKIILTDCFDTVTKFYTQKI